MTQLFDTETYDYDEKPGRHLRSIPAGTNHGAHDLQGRTTQWRLDQDTIEIGRKGIQAARQALQDAARAAAKPKTERQAA